MSKFRYATREEPITRSFWLKRSLASAFSEMMGRKSSRAVAAGMVVMMALSKAEQEELMEIARDRPPEEAIKEVRRWMSMRARGLSVGRQVAQMNDKQRSRIIQTGRSKPPARGRR
jgi:hypothetical protein